MWERKGNIFNKHHAQVPVVFAHDSYFRIYYSERIDNKSYPFYIDVDINDPSKILYESPYPILALGTTGKFDHAGIMPTEIISTPNGLFLYYIGWTNRIDVPYHNNIGLAISKDSGKTWEKISEGPIFSTSRKEPGYVGTISILKKDCAYLGYYLSCREWASIDGRMEPFYDIKLATSANLIDWIPTNKTIIPLEEGEGGASKASVVELNGEYYMWYSIRKAKDYRTDTNSSYRIKCIKSKYLYEWEKYPKFDFDVDVESDWDNFMVAYPHVIIHNDKVHMFYNGNGFGKTGIGYATLKF